MLFFNDKCPLCGIKGTKIEKDTLLNHVKDISKIGNGGYSFCNHPSCDAVYFSGSDVFTTSMINKELGCKENSSEQATLCYCYNYLKGELIDEALIEKINIRINHYGSRCDLRNPSGKCCLSEIKQLQKKYDEEIGE